VRSAVFSISASAFARAVAAAGASLRIAKATVCLLGFFGLGALLGATGLAFFRRRLSADALVSLATAVFALATFAAGRWQTFPVLSVTMLIAGIAWIQILASLNVSAQTMSPGHMRARAISMYLLVLQGGLAGGAALWGELPSGWAWRIRCPTPRLAWELVCWLTFWFRLRSVEIHPNALAMN